MDPFCCSLISEQNKVKKIHFFIKNDELQMTGPDSRAAFDQIPGSVASMARIYHDSSELNDVNRNDILAARTETIHVPLTTPNRRKSKGRFKRRQVIGYLENCSLYTLQRLSGNRYR